MKQNTPIGARIKLLRTNNNLTLKQLSEKTGLSVGFLSQLERGMSSVAIDALEKIAHVLGVTLASFFEEEKKETADPVIHSFSLHSTQVSPQIIQTVLSQDVLAFDMLPRLFHLMPFANMEAEDLEMYSHSGEEFIYVLEGIVTLVLNGRQYTLYPGDSVHIHSNAEHNWMNSTNKIAKLLSINTPNPFQHPEAGHILP